MCIKSDAKNGQQYQKFAVSELSTVGIGFISIFLLKARVLNLTISKRENLRLPLKVETDQFAFCLVLPVSFCQNLLHFTLGQWSESWRLWCRFSFSVVFLSFKNSSPREKVRKLSSFWDWWAESLFVSLWSWNIIFCPALTMATRAKKNFWLSDLLTPSARECTIEIWSTLTDAWLCQLCYNMIFYVTLLARKDPNEDNTENSITETYKLL